MWLWAKAKKEIYHNWGVLTSSKSWSEGINPALTLTAMLFPRWRLRCDRHSKCLTLKTGTGELHTAQNLSPHSPWSLKATETNNAKLHAEENVLFLLCVCEWVWEREEFSLFCPLWLLGHQHWEAQLCFHANPPVYHGRDTSVWHWCLLSLSNLSICSLHPHVFEHVLFACIISIIML